MEENNKMLWNNRKKKPKIKIAKNIHYPYNPSSVANYIIGEENCNLMSVFYQKHVSCIYEHLYNAGCKVPPFYQKPSGEFCALWFKGLGDKAIPCCFTEKKMAKGAMYMYTEIT